MRRWSSEKGICAEPARLARVVVLHGGLEVLADRRRLRELAAQPAEQAHLGGFHAGSLSRPATPRTGPEAHPAKS